ncbi:hypothetical protein CLV43_1011163 [Umezawaea tangerina]|uniref:Uncharacterized protein n=1 Tax=Umezawaea tangerina TaxID=84725 RepID=A0A2T0TMD4_9PSEU|nr:hypothetical protein CLV43_1011163 [Umezawaea tangerina]
MTWGLVLLVIALVGLGTAVALWWPLTGAGTAALQRASATVTRPASCGAGGSALDEVEVKVDGQVRKAKLDGCGHRQAEVVEVLLPEDRSGELTVQTAGAASDAPPLRARLETLMLCLSGLAGGFYAYLVSRPVPRLRSVFPAIS